MSQRDPFAPTETLPPPAAEVAPAPEAEQPAPPPLTSVKEFASSSSRTSSVDTRIKRIEDFLEAFSGDWKLVWTMFQNYENEKSRSSEMLTYRCLGLNNDGSLCGATMQAKRPEFRSYEERLICPNPAHRGDLTPMEPVL